MNARPMSSRTTAAFLSVFFSVFFLTALVGQEAHAKRLKPDPATASKAITPEIVEAVATEMKRSQKSLTIPGAPSPYFFAYKLTEVEVNDVAASLGSVIGDRDNHFVSLEAHVHVGNYKSDNSNFVSKANEGVDGIATITLPLEATPSLTRRATWRATDAAYKEAINQLSAKRDALSTGASGGTTEIPNYTAAKPVVSLKPSLVAKLATPSDLGKRAETISATFRDHSHVRSSRVAFTSFLERRWLINSEGTKVHDTRRVSGVLIVASGQAADGQELNVYYSRYGQTEADLPTDAVLAEEAKRLAKTIKELAKAPLVDNYAGPVLFTSGGAVDMVRHGLARNLSGTPLPVGLPPNEARNFGGGLITRLGLKVTPSWLSVTDDPTVLSTGKGSKRRALIGGYRNDDEGVAPQRVVVISKGRLETLLMSRTPSDKIRKSNGHARLRMPGGVFRGSPTNTFVTSQKKLSKRALESALIKAVKAAGLKYGLVIEQFDDPAITANAELSRFELLRMLQSVNPDAPPPAAVAYRLYPSGKRELVRGVQLQPIEIGQWRNLLATGSNTNIKNFLASTTAPLFLRLQGVGDGFTPSEGIESSVVTPDLLFEELEILRTTVGRRPAPILPVP